MSRFVQNLILPVRGEQSLIESLDVQDYPLSATWQAEIRRRCAEIDNSTDRLRDADTVFKNAYASLA